MKFAIRDDDTCYFTSPEDLKKAYGELWGKIPISLAVVPFVKARKAPFIPKEFWESNKEYPVGENQELVSFLKKEIKNGNVSIMLHGYNHEYYPQPEFVGGKNLKEKVIEGKRYLEEVLETEINTFVPPSNSMSKEGILAVKEAGLKLLYYPTPKGRPNSFRKWKVFLDDLLFKYKERQSSRIGFLKNCYNFWIRKNRDVFMPVKPFPYEINGIKEFNCVSLTSKTSINNVIRNIGIANSYDGYFCLAVHYHAFNNQKFKDKFEQVFNYTQDKNNMQLVHVDSILGGGMNDS